MKIFKKKRKVLYSHTKKKTFQILLSIHNSKILIYVIKEEEKKNHPTKQNKKPKKRKKGKAKSKKKNKKKQKEKKKKKALIGISPIYKLPFTRTIGVSIYLSVYTNWRCLLKGGLLLNWKIL